MSATYQHIVDHYEECLKRHGDTHLGVDWPNPEDAIKRYLVMLELLGEDIDDPETTLLDFGCGAAHLLDHMENGVLPGRFRYAGLDLSNRFIDLCRKKHPDTPFYCADVLKGEDDLPVFEYVILNGVLTEKRDTSQQAMEEYLCQLIERVFKMSTRGIAFNVMSKNVDWERDDLFHVSIDWLTAFLSKRISRNFIIRSDYGLYEYTTCVYHAPRYGGSK